MSIGVLHHLPDPFQGFVRLAALVKPGGMMLLWLYSAQRRLSNLLLEQMRRVVRPLSNRMLHGLSFVFAIPDFIVAKGLKVLPKGRYAHLIPTHFRLYADLPFSTSWADWFDRLGAPIRHYYTREELGAWLKHIGAKGEVYPTEDFGWTPVARLGVGRDQNGSMLIS
jgi:hypothetical protein